jgi:hypothetical protein
MAVRISFADLSDATGIPADLLAAEVIAMQREAQAAPPSPEEPSHPVEAPLPLASSVERAAA